MFFLELKKRIHSKPQERSERPFFKANTACRVLGTIHRMRGGGRGQSPLSPPKLQTKTEIDNQFYPSRHPQIFEATYGPGHELTASCDAYGERYHMGWGRGHFYPLESKASGKSWKSSPFDTLQRFLRFLKLSLSLKLDFFCKNAYFVFLARLLAFVGQPENHIVWATLIPFGSIYHSNQRTNPWKFCFESAISIFFALSPWKSVNIYRLARMGRNFDDYPGFQPKTTFLCYYAHNCT